MRIGTSWKGRTTGRLSGEDEAERNVTDITHNETKEGFEGEENDSECQASNNAVSQPMLLLNALLADH